MIIDEQELLIWRRHLHSHPELGRDEHNTTAYVAEQLSRVGLQPRLLPGTGLTCEVGDGAGPVVLLRADLDALPLSDTKDVSYRSRSDGVTHACGHDAHTAMLLGAGLALHRIAVREGLAGRVRLLFQPAEEIMPGGALDCIAQGVLDGVSEAYALHCDPALDVGLVGVRSGPITAAADWLEVRLQGPGGHTSRPQNTVDLVGALAAVATQTPHLLSRRMDARGGASLVWGAIAAGEAANAIPAHGLLRGTVRILDVGLWRSLPELVTSLIEQAVAPYGAEVQVTYTQGVPPVVNAVAPAKRLRQAAQAVATAVTTKQSMGGEDFGWYLDHVPGAMARLGVRRPGWSGPVVDLHQASFDLDEAALATGSGVLVRTALDALHARDTDV